MKKLILIILICLGFASLFLYIIVNRIDAYQGKHCHDPEHIEKILSMNPEKVAEKEFYRYEFDIMAGYSGSGGSFLPDKAIEWLKKAESSFENRGIKLKDEYSRHIAFIDSYYHNHEFEKALHEAEIVDNSEWIELLTWFIENGALKGIIKIKEFPGRIPFNSSVTARIEDSCYIFVGFHKGPVCRYDKANDRHAIIYASYNEYDWPESFEWDGENLYVKLTENSIIFNNKTNCLNKNAYLIGEN